MSCPEPSSKRLKRNYNDLFAWLGELGAKTCHLGVESDGDAGDCVKLIENVVVGQPSVVVPHECVLTVEKAWTSELGAKVKRCGQECSNELMLWLFMAQGRACKSSSSSSCWGCYLTSLPETADIPAAWSNARFEHELQGTPLHSVVKVERSAIRAEFAAVSEALGEVPGISWEGVLWAYSMFRSRSFPGHLGNIVYLPTGCLISQSLVLRRECDRLHGASSGPPQPQASRGKTPNQLDDSIPSHCTALLTPTPTAL